jgi:hypothetical protein
LLLLNSTKCLQQLEWLERLERFEKIVADFLSQGNLPLIHCPAPFAFGVFAEDERFVRGNDEPRMLP